MNKNFLTIGLIGKHRHHETTETFNELIDYLQHKNRRILIEEETGELLDFPNISRVKRSALGSSCDLVIAVGGDGSLLQAARSVVDSQTPILGINRGRLGFLTDIKPDQLEKLDAIFRGDYLKEERFLLEVSNKQTASSLCALNDVVLSSGDPAHMIEFEIYVNGIFMSRDRSDGMIIATPTGSTAYALSGGGPIIHPALNAIVLVPMFSHTLSSRPIVIPGDSHLTLIIVSKAFTHPPLVSADGEEYCSLDDGQTIDIRKKHTPLVLLHPSDYDYFENVRSKLYWGQKLTS